MDKIRDYQQIVNELFNLQTPFKKEVIGYVNYWKRTYPILKLSLSSSHRKKTILITSGHHGDEPFAVHTLIAWIKQFKSKDFKNLEFYIFPICNPWGFETGSRENGYKQDTNNDQALVKNSKVAELAILFEHFPLLTDLFIDLHGETYQTHAYCYEKKLDLLPSLATIALQEVDSIIPYSRQKTILKNPIEKGVMCPRLWEIGLEGLMEKRGIKYSITVELPGRFDGQKRIEGGIAILNSILHHYSEIK
jgi:predicted deacylase